MTKLHGVFSGSAGRARLLWEAVLIVLMWRGQTLLVTAAGTAIFFRLERFDGARWAAALWLLPIGAGWVMAVIAAWRLIRGEARKPTLPAAGTYHIGQQ